MSRTRYLNLAVLRDIDEARAAMEEALATAEPGEAPGLRRALDILAAAAAGDEDIKIRWARRRLAEAGVAPGDTGVRAIKELRQAVPGLGLAEAVELVKLAAGR